MRPAAKIIVAGAGLALSAGGPVMLWHHARLALRARQDAWQQTATRLSALAEESVRLSNRVAQATTPALTQEQLYELLRLRNKRRLLGEQTNLLAHLEQENRHVEAGDGPKPESLSPAQLQTALSEEMVEAMNRILPLLQPAMQLYAAAHSNQPPSEFSGLKPYFPLLAGQRMAGLNTFNFVREQRSQPGELVRVEPSDALLLYGEAGPRPEDNCQVRVYGFRDGRVVEVASEDGHFDDWENAHLSSPLPGADEKIYLEAAGTARERARMVELGTSVGISAEQASLFFDRSRQEEKLFRPRLDELRKNLTGSPEENQRQIQAAAQEDLRKLAIETLGDHGPPLVDKLIEGL